MTPMMTKDRTHSIALPTRTPANKAGPTLLAAIAAVTGLAGVTSAASAATTPWNPPAGSANTFTYAAGSNDTGAFGDPTLSGDKFLFFPANFAASTSPTAGTSSDRLSAVLTAKPGFDLSAVSIRLIGDYSALRGGTIDAQSFLRITPLDLNGVALGGGMGGTGLSEAMVDFPTLPASTAGSFDATASLAFASGVRSALVEVDADLFASALDGGAAFIQLKNAILGVETTDSPAVVPLPAGALAAIPAGLIAVGAIRRKRRA